VEFTNPQPLSEAMQIAQQRKLLPTNVGSAEITQWGDELKRFSVFSARTTNADYLQAIKNVTEDLLQGEFNEATAKMLLKAKLIQLDYDPARGFPGDVNIPPATPGSLQDLSSDTRLQLVVRTQMRQMANLGYRQQGMTPGSLFSFPAWELVRIYPKQVPRGSAKSKSLGWPARWKDAGGTLYGGRMIAPKADKVWTKLGDNNLFDDAIGTDYPPFAFNSGMGWTAVSRGACEALGVPIDKTPPAPPKGIDMAQLSVKGIDREFLQELRNALDIEIREGYARLKEQSKT
jgi:hypothetical protein